MAPEPPSHSTRRRKTALIVGGLVVLLAAAAWWVLRAPRLVAPSPRLVPTALRSIPAGPGAENIGSCESDGARYFQIGNHRVRVDPKLWRLRDPRTTENTPADTLPTKACRKAPLRLLRLEIVSQSPYTEGNLIHLYLADGTHPDFRHLHADFLPHESSCKRGPHWTWCSTEKTMQLVEGPSPADTDPWVSLKFDLDFYATPTGRAYFVSTRGEGPLYIQRYAVNYLWDDSLVIGYSAKPCRWMPPLREQNCTPLNYLSLDRRMQEVLRSVLDQPEVEQRRIKGAGTQPKSSASSVGVAPPQW